MSALILLARRIATPLLSLAVALAVFAAPAAAEESITLKRSELEALITKMIDERVKSLGLEGDAFNDRVATGIDAYVKKRQETAQAKVHEKAPLARKVSADDDYIYGDPKAPFTLIEYSDFECPYCKRFHATPKQLVDKYPGKVNWVYRHYPLGFHNPHAQKQAEASECAGELQGNDGFWKYTDELYLRTKSNKGFPIENLVPLAVELGFDSEKFKSCLDSERHAAKVKADMADGQKAGVTGTPGNVLRHNTSNESRLLSGALSVERIEKTLTELAEKTGETL